MSESHRKTIPRDPLTLFVINERPIIHNYMQLRDWLYVTNLKGWIEDAVLKVRASDVFKLIPDVKAGKRLELLIKLVSDEPPKDLGGCPIEVLPC